ncbi:MAG: TfoX/Sxy family protein [Chitinophagales bacterium]|nr:TfoX/Sxy family protein [Chitinophagales bacterium]
MAYNEKLNDRVREAMSELPNVEEKHMFGGTCYMLNDKMCIGIVRDELMCRIGPDVYEQALEQPGCREMIFTGKPMKGYVFVDEQAVKSNKDLNYWLDLCLAFNKHAKSSKKKKK